MTRYALALPSDQPVQIDGFGAITRDGSRIVSSFLGATQLWVKQRNELTARTVPGVDGLTAMALAPDGSRVAVVVPSGIRIVSLDGKQGGTVAATVSPAAGGLAWLDDDSFVYVARDRFALERVTDLGAGTTSTIWRSDSLIPENVTPLPGARGVLFQACLAPCPTGNLYLLDFKADSARLLLRKGDGPSSLGTRLPPRAARGTWRVTFDKGCRVRLPTRRVVTLPCRPLARPERADPSASSASSPGRPRSVVQHLTTGLDALAEQGYPAPEQPVDEPLVGDLRVNVARVAQVPHRGPEEVALEDTSVRWRSRSSKGRWLEGGT